MGANGGGFQRSPYDHAMVDKVRQVGVFIDPLALPEPATRADIDALRAELRELRVAIEPPASPLILGAEARPQYLALLRGQGA